jgi:hypothetical protein
LDNLTSLLRPDANFRRSINLVGGSTTAVRLVDSAPGGVDAAEARDDGSGVHDYTPSEVRHPFLALFSPDVFSSLTRSRGRAHPG